MLYFDGDGRLVASRRQPGDAAFGWWLSDWVPSADDFTSGDIGSGHAIVNAPLSTDIASSQTGGPQEDEVSDDSVLGNDSRRSSTSFSEQMATAWTSAEEADSGVGSGATSLAPVQTAAPPSPPSMLRLLRVLRAPECEHSEEQLRAAEAQRTARVRVDGLRADARALLRDTQRLRRQMQACEAHAQSVRGGARRLSEDLRETRHLDAVLRWLRRPPPDIAFAALPDDAHDAQGEDPPSGTPQATCNKSHESAAGEPLSSHGGELTIFRRYRSEGDLRLLEARRYNHATPEVSKSAPAAYCLLPTDFEESYFDVEPRPASTDCEMKSKHYLLLLPTDFETPYVEIERIQTPTYGCSKHTNITCSRGHVDCCDEGLKLIRDTEGRDTNSSQLNLHRGDRNRTSRENNESDVEINSDDDWSLLSFGSNTSDECCSYDASQPSSAKWPPTYIDIRPENFRPRSPQDFPETRLTVPPSRHLQFYEGNSQQSIEQAVNARFRRHCFTVAEDDDDDDDDDDGARRVRTPVLSRGYSV